MILIPEWVADKERAEKRAAYQKELEDRFRAVVRKHLLALGDELGEFEQTTHGRIVLTTGIEGVALELADCYRKPSAFNISNLSQAIAALVKEPT